MDTYVYYYIVLCCAVIIIMNKKSQLMSKTEWKFDLPMGLLFRIRPLSTSIATQSRTNREATREWNLS
jgi:hypothetical protein